LGTTNQASSLLQIADGGLSNITDILSRQKALAVSANSGSLSDTERAFLQQEFSALTSEIDRIVGSTEFNGIKLLDGSVSGDAGLTTATTDGSYSLNAASDYDVTSNPEVTYSASALATANATTAVNFTVAQDGGTQEVEVIGFTGATTQALSAEVSTKVFDGTTVGASFESGTFTLTAVGVDTETVIIDGITFAFDASAPVIANQEVAIGTNATDSAANLAAAINYHNDNVGFTNGSITATSAAGVLTVTVDDVADIGLNGGPRFAFTGTSISEGTNSSTTANTVGIAGETLIVDGETYTFVANGVGNDFANNQIEVGGTATETAANAAGQVNYDNAAGGVFTSPVTASNNAGTTLTLTATSAAAQNELIITGTEGSVVTNTAGLASDILTIAGQAFTFAENGTASSGLVIEQGGSEAATLINIVNHLNDATTNGGAAASANVALFSYAVDGNNIVATANDALADGGLTFDSNNAVAGALASLDVAGVASAALTTTATFQATLQGSITELSSTFLASDANNNARIQFTATVGGETYVSNLLDLGATPALTGGQVLTFTSQSSTGTTDATFSLTLGAATTAITGQTEASTLASAIQADLDDNGIVINQAREISSFTAANTNGTVLAGLTAADVTINAESFDTTGGFGSLGAFDVDAANNRITTTIDGEVYTADLTVYDAGAGTYSSSTKILDNAGSLSFTSASATDGRTLDINLTNITVGSIDISSDSGQAALESVLNNAFDIGGGSGLTFQVGVDATDNIGVTIAGANTSTLFVDGDGASVSLDISTAGLSGTENGGDGTGSILASNVIDRALNAVTGLRAEVGALQSRFNFASSNISSAIQNTDAARSNFLDVDVAEESTKFATAQVRLQASISVLAQANQLPQNLLKLIG